MSSKQYLTAVVVSVLCACGSVPDKRDTSIQSNLPKWVTDPVVVGGFADTQCVANNADESILKAKATTLARAAIAQQIETQVKAIDKAYADLVDVASESTSSGTFESVFNQLVKHNINSSRTTQSDYIDFPDGSSQLCIMVSLSPESTQALYNELVDKSAVKLSQQNESALFQVFKAYRTNQDIE